VRSDIGATGSKGCEQPLRARAVRKTGRIARRGLHATFTPHVVLISTWPEGSSHWLERDLVDRAREKLDVPVEHVISRFGVEEEQSQPLV
jgi:hypothetical protein